MAPAAPVTATLIGFFSVAAAAEEANRRASRREAMIDADARMMERAKVARITNGRWWGTRISRWAGQVAEDVRRQGAGPKSTRPAAAIAVDWQLLLLGTKQPNGWNYWRNCKYSRHARIRRHPDKGSIRRWCVPLSVSRTVPALSLAFAAMETSIVKRVGDDTCR